MDVQYPFMDLHGNWRRNRSRDHWVTVPPKRLRLSGTREVGLATLSMDDLEEGSVQSVQAKEKTPLKVPQKSKFQLTVQSMKGAERCYMFGYHMIPPLFRSDWWSSVCMCVLFFLGERRNQMRKDAESPSHCRMHYTEIKETSNETFSETRSHVMHQNNRNKPCSMFPIRFLYLHESSSIHILNPSKSACFPLRQASPT